MIHNGFLRNLSCNHSALQRSTFLSRSQWLAVLLAISNVEDLNVGRNAYRGTCGYTMLVPCLDGLGEMLKPVKFTALPVATWISIGRKVKYESRLSSGKRKNVIIGKWFSAECTHDFLWYNRLTQHLDLSSSAMVPRYHGLTLAATRRWTVDSNPGYYGISCLKSSDFYCRNLPQPHWLITP